jgi:membrane protease YdiL (CAAX protease family)
MKDNMIKNLLYVVLFVALFYIIQVAVQLAGSFIQGYADEVSFATVLEGMKVGQYSKTVAVTIVFSSLITVALFFRTGWTPMSRDYIKSRPWSVFFWVVVLALGTIIPAEWTSEKANLMMPDEAVALFEGIMKEPWGYAAIGILAPIAEEVVFRGAVTRVLLNIFPKQYHWAGIIVAALIFGVVHLNLAQGIHAFIIGLLLGWMYYRTRSIIPGVVLHWVNNSVAYIMFNMMPDMNDGKLIDLFHGDERMMLGGLFFSLCMMVPALIQLTFRMKR